MLKSLTTSQKIRSAFAIATVFILVFVTNQSDKQYYDSIKETMKTIHEDRLVAKGYLYELNSIFFEKQIEVLQNDGFQPNLKKNQEIQSLIENFAETKFTKKEKYQFKDFNREVEQLFMYEKEMEAKEELTEEDIAEYCARLDTIAKSLKELAKIQVGEGENQLKSARLNTEKNDFLAQIELWIIIGVGLIIQFLIFYRFKA
ncbi:MAG: hypothetical protein RJQ00_11210 [Vicingaceae bacterium]